MQISPRYGPNPIITLDGSPSAILEPVRRQRHRLASVLDSFDDAQWAHPSRCDAWSNRDVVVHLDGTNAFWTESIAAGLRGEPSQFLATFDPVHTPAAIVAGSDLAPAAVRERFTASTDALTNLLASLDEGDWSVAAEAPPGHLAISAVAHHALWDCWVHERDILVPLGIEPAEEPDEVEACLRYAAALGPALALDQGTIAPGVCGLVGHDPDIAMDLEISDAIAVRAGCADPASALRGGAIELVEGLSIRGPLPTPVPAAWVSLLQGLSDVFEVDPA